MSAFMPQWDFLNYLAQVAGQYKNFCLVKNAEVTELMEPSRRAAACRRN